MKNKGKIVNAIKNMRYERCCNHAYVAWVEHLLATTDIKEDDIIILKERDTEVNFEINKITYDLNKILLIYDKIDDKIIIYLL